MKKIRFFSLFFLQFILAASFVLAQNETATEPMNRDCGRFHQQSAWVNSLARNEKAFPVDLMFVGDSITQGWEGAGREVWKKYYGNRRAFNFGISGDRTGHVLWRLENTQLQKISPKLIVVMIGTNNRTQPEETADGIEKIVKTLEVKFPSAKILLLDVFPRSAKSDDGPRQRICRINDLIRNRFDGDPRIIRMDLTKCFLEEDGTLPASVMPDFLHPNAEGYARWAAAMEPEIEKVIGPIPACPPECVGVPREMARFNAKNEILKKGNIDVLMLGDSITHGWEGNGAEAWKELFKDTKAVNLGTGWDRTENVIWRLENYDFSNVNPTKAFLLIGVNNNASSSPENIGLGNRKICALLHEKFPEMKIYVQKVFPWGQDDAKGKNQKRERINAEIEKAVADLNYVTVLDLSSCFLTEDGKLDRNAMTPDLVHLQKLGYERWAKAIAPYVK
ncbi:MAG: hypothetical protein IJF17_00785 [Thermoguttaceae bacterium]|nr:hypothetical protein [Thermoguttaceae bacterium]